MAWSGVGDRVANCAKKAASDMPVAGGLRLVREISALGRSLGGVWFLWPGVWPMVWQSVDVCDLGAGVDF